MPRTEVVRTYLRLLSPEALHPAPWRAGDATVAPEAPCAPATYRALYESVGRAHHWRDRLAWSDDALAAHLARPDVAVWIVRVAGEPGGFFELVKHPDTSVEIAYFGLVPKFIGRGLGKQFLTRAVEEAWRAGASRVWLHTCTLDAPQALPNYLARGFVPERTETYLVDLPD
jgi:GNAT superfamily N-acetyltransferase